MENTLGVTPRDLKESEFHRIADELGNRKIDLLLIHVAERSSATPYSVREVENTLDEMALPERHDFQKAGDVYRWKKHYRFRIR